MNIEHDVRELKEKVRKLEERVVQLELQRQAQVPPPKEDPPNMMHF
jgi:hypothetical protein